LIYPIARALALHAENRIRINDRDSARLHVRNNVPLSEYPRFVRDICPHNNAKNNRSKLDIGRQYTI